MSGADRLFTEERIEAMAEGLFRLSGAEGSWADLDDDERAPDRAGAAGIPAHVRLLGLTVREADRPARRPLRPDEVEAAARAEHDRWAAFTRSRGYRRGPVRDDERMVHPDLVPWEELDEPTRDLDRRRVRAIPDLLADVGLELRDP